MSQADKPVEQLEDELRAITALETMLKCDRRGLCLLKEWMRRYGEAGSGCRCFWLFSEAYAPASHAEFEL